MKENYYTILMRKNITGTSTEEENKILYDWLDTNEEYLNFFAWLCLKVNAIDTFGFDKGVLTREPGKKAEDHRMTRQELDELVRKFLKVKQK